MATRHQVDLQQGITLRQAYLPELQHRLLAVRHLVVVGIRLILLLIARQPMLQRLPRISSHFSFLISHFYDSPVRLMHLAVAEHLVQTCQRLRRAGKDHQPADGTVQPVYHAQEHSTGLGILLLDIGLHQVRERSIAGLVSLYDLSALLVYYDNMVVLVDYVHHYQLITYSFHHQPGSPGR